MPIMTTKLKEHKVVEDQIEITITIEADGKEYKQTRSFAKSNYLNDKGELDTARVKTELLDAHERSLTARIQSGAATPVATEEA